MMLKARTLGVEREAIKSADKANVFHVALLGSMDGAQLAKCVDNDTEDLGMQKGRPGEAQSWRRVWCWVSGEVLPAEKNCGGRAVTHHVEQNGDDDCPKRELVCEAKGITADITRHCRVHEGTDVARSEALVQRIQETREQRGAHWNVFVRIIA
eukprot:scaffold216901_cov28-Tisochrysis_lutea.AAC.3